jgi:CBS domain-containing protein
MVSGRDESTVADYMSTDMFTIGSQSSLLEVARKMVETNISSVVITKNSGRVGILTERDIVKAIASGIPPDGITAGSLMSHPLMTVDASSSLEEAAKFMAKNKVRHVLVTETDTNNIVGILTATDLIRYLKQTLTDKEIVASEVWELFF